MATKLLLPPRSRLSLRHWQACRCGHQGLDVRLEVLLRWHGTATVLVLAAPRLLRLRPGGLPGSKALGAVEGQRGSLRRHRSLRRATQPSSTAAPRLLLSRPGRLARLALVAAEPASFVRRRVRATPILLCLRPGLDLGLVVLPLLEALGRAAFPIGLAAEVELQLRP